MFKSVLLASQQKRGKNRPRRGVTNHAKQAAITGSLKVLWVVCEGSEGILEIQLTENSANTWNVDG